MRKIDIIRSKILGEKSLDSWLAIARFHKYKIVFTNGCFDILHQGHVSYLSAAADAGDRLIVGLNTDNSVKKIKGEGRPFMDQDSRALLLASLHVVSAVVLFDEETPYRLIQQIQPDVLVKGSDYKPEDIVGYDIVMAKSGQVLTLDFVKGYSSSSIIKKISDSHS